MPNISAIFKYEIIRLARKEIRSETRAAKKATAQYRRDIARLKREVSKLEAVLKRLAKRVGAAELPSIPEEKAARARFSAKGLRSHRSRLGLSAADYGKLAGVTGQTIYKWEQGAAKPRRRQVALLAALRGIGKREAKERLEK